MNKPTRSQRLAVALASAITTIALFPAVVGAARPPVADSLFAQAAAVRVA